MSLAHQRFMAQTLRILRNPRCSRETYIEVIREYGLREETDEFRQLLALWKKFRGND